ncbi:MAG: hypothetical protein Q4A54_01020 [Parabacteroides sp.]|nr:hypothetical protein [Parabacteroides sp.]
MEKQEKSEKALEPDAEKRYYDIFHLMNILITGQMKFVIVRKEK